LPLAHRISATLDGETTTRDDDERRNDCERDGREDEQWMFERSRTCRRTERKGALFVLHLSRSGIVFQPPSDFLQEDHILARTREAAMAYRQRFRGYARFPSDAAARTAHARLISQLPPEAMVRADQVILELDDESGEVTVDVDAYGPATGFMATVTAFDLLAEGSEGGGIDCVLEADEIEAFVVCFPELERVPLFANELRKRYPERFHPEISVLAAPFPATPREEEVQDRLRAASPLRRTESVEGRLIAAARLLLGITADAVRRDADDLLKMAREELHRLIDMGAHRSHALLSIHGAQKRLAAAEKEPQGWLRRNPLRMAVRREVSNLVSQTQELLEDQSLLELSRTWGAARALARSAGLSTRELPISEQDNNTILAEPAARCVCDRLLFNLGVTWWKGKMEVGLPYESTVRTGVRGPIGAFAVRLAAVAGSPLMPQLLLRTTADHRKVFTHLVLAPVTRKLALSTLRAAEVALAGYDELAAVADRIRSGEADAEAMEAASLSWYRRELERLPMLDTDPGRAP
jgi:hypothetical protein